MTFLHVFLRSPHNDMRTCPKKMLSPSHCTQSTPFFKMQPPLGIARSSELRNVASSVPKIHKGYVFKTFPRNSGRAQKGAHLSNRHGSAKVRCSSCCSLTEGMVYSVGGQPAQGDPASAKVTRELGLVGTASKISNTHLRRLTAPPASEPSPQNRIVANSVAALACASRKWRRAVVSIVSLKQL